MAAGDAVLSLRQFPPGTQISAYKGPHARGAPLDGTPDATVTLSSTQTATFTGLAAGAHAATDAPTNEVQTLTVDATAGTFRLRFGSDTTLDQAYNVSAANLQTALRGLSSIGSGNVTVSGGPGDSGGTSPYVITWISSKAATAVATLEILAGATALSGGGATATIAKTTPGRTGGSRFVDFVPAA